MLGEDAGGLGVVDRLGLVGEVRREGLELGGEVVGEELFVESGFHYWRFELVPARPSSGVGLGVVEMARSRFKGGLGRTPGAPRPCR